MKTLLDRFCRYVRIDTQADEAARTYPSTPGQLELGRLLVQELHALGLRDAVLVGWSMGAMVLWDYLGQFAADPRLAGAVVVSQGPSDLTQAGWPYGIADLTELRSYLQLAQDDFAAFFAGFRTTRFFAGAAVSSPTVSTRPAVLRSATEITMCDKRR